MPSILAICRVDNFPSRYRVSATAAVEEAFFDNPFGLPPTLPLARVAFNPACVRSLIISRSNSASEAMRLIAHCYEARNVVLIAVNSIPSALYALF